MSTYITKQADSLSLGKLFMKITSMRLIFCCLIAALLSSCGILGAGSHVYCETTTLACPSDSIIQRLIRLKASGRFDDVRSFPDHLAGEQWIRHDFYFYDSEQQFLVRMEVPIHTPTTTTLHLADIKNFKSGTEWLGFAKAREEQKQLAWAWFNRTILPELTGKSIQNP